MALLRGAREETPELFFRCFSEELQKGFKGLETAGRAQLAAALKSGVDSAYKAVMKPTEGTVLTVARVSAEKAAAFSAAEKDASKVLECAYEAAKVALFANTPPNSFPFSKRPALSTQADRAMFIFLRECFRLFATER